MGGDIPRAGVRLNPREAACWTLPVPLLCYRHSVTSCPPTPAIRPPRVEPRGTPQTVSQNKPFLLKMLLVKCLPKAIRRGTDILSETSMLCIFLSMLVFLMPPEWPIKLCIERFKISLTHSYKLLHIPPTNQFQKLQVYNSNMPTVGTDCSIGLLAHHCDQYQIRSDLMEEGLLLPPV